MRVIDLIVVLALVIYAIAVLSPPDLYVRFGGTEECVELYACNNDGEVDLAALTECLKEATGNYCTIFCASSIPISVFNTMDELGYEVVHVQLTGRVIFKKTE